MRPPMRSPLADQSNAEMLPLEDVCVDVQGPFTLSDEGFQYTMSYHCNRLKVPKIKAFKSMQAGYVARVIIALM